MSLIMRLDKVAGARNPGEVLNIAWESILEKDYAPVFEPGLAVLGALPDGNEAVDNAIRAVAECANRVADSLSDLGYDHAGPLYHRILGSAKSDGAFYTNNLSAVMLARLALTEDFADWSDPEAVARLRVMDPACGTGTLLMAALQTVKARVAANRETGDEERNTLHKRLVEDVLCGLDINRHAVQLAACNMTLGAPTVDYERMNLLTMRHGPQSDGSVSAGSLELLATADREASLGRLIHPLRTLDDLNAEQVDRAEEAAFPLENLDLVIMNPPYTDNKKRGRKFGAEAVRRMQRHELDIRNRVEQRDEPAGRVITTNSIRTFFTPLVDHLLRIDQGVLAMVIPATACIGASGADERRFLAERFHVERIVTTHDPRRVNFSENTSIHECLLVCRRLPEGERPPTEFVSLRQMPDTVEEATAAADAIATGEPGHWGNVHYWPSDRVRSGDWTPVQWYDGTLAQAARDVELNRLLEAVGTRYRIGPSGQSVQDAYEVGDEDMPGSIPGFHSVSGALRRTIRGEHDVWYVPRRGRRRKMEQLIGENEALRGRLLVPMRLDTIGGRLTGVWSAQPAFGWWVPVAAPGDDRQKALAAWWNSTPVRLMLLNRRAQKLTYPTWQLAHLREIRIPKPNNHAWASLSAAFDQVCDRELLPMKYAEECEARRVIDDAAALALSIDAEILADWRRRLAAEPTITNTRGDLPGSDNT